MFNAYILKKLLGANSGPVGEQALEVERAEVNMIRHRFEVRLVLLVTGDEIQGISNSVIVVHDLFLSNVDQQPDGGNPIIAVSENGLAGQPKQLFRYRRFTVYAVELLELVNAQ